MAPYTATVERKKQHRVEVTVTFDVSLTKPAEEIALQRLGQNVQLEGFRPGKAPPDMIKQHINSQQLFEETVRMLLQEHLGALLEENKIQPIIPPRVEAVSRDPMTLKVVFEEKPEVSVKGADKIKVAKKDMKVEEKDIEGIIKNVQDQYATKAVVERASKEGDEVMMDFVGTDGDGKEVPGATAEGYEIQIGSKQLVPGFEENLVGLKPGEKKTFTVTMPKEYHAKELAGKPMTFAITIKEIREVNRPEVNDAFVKEKLQLESLSAWKKQIEDNIRAQDERYFRMQREQELFDAIGKATKVELADELIEEETRALIDEFAHRLEHRGQSLQDWLQQTGKKPDEAEKEFKEQAKERLTIRLGLAWLIEDKKIELSQEETDALAKNVLGGEKKVSQGQATERLQNAVWQAKVEKLVEGMLKD